jgi:hypothetical protein
MARREKSHLPFRDADTPIRLAWPAAHFDRNKRHVISATGHYCLEPVSQLFCDPRAEVDEDTSVR